MATVDGGANGTPRRAWSDWLDGPSVADKMIEYNNRSTGFDYLRIGLSLSVLVWHSFFLTIRLSTTETPLGGLVHMILPMFFALSGFLISGSLSRTRSMREFVTLRAVRILPALAVEVLLSAFLIGVALTTLPLGDYLTHPTFLIYFRNLYGDVHMLLPGVFAGNPLPFVNVSLWTIPYELECYLAVVVLWFVGAVPNKKLLLLALILVAQFALPLRDFINHDMIRPTANNLPGRMLVLSFLYGVAIYFFAARIVLRPWLAVVAGIACLIMLQNSWSAYLVAFPAAYLTVFLGLTNPPKIPVLMDGDYSYGIYLYAAPIQQTVIALVPDGRIWWVNLLVTIVPICVFAAISWHLVEKPILGRRKAILAGMMRTTDPMIAPLRRVALSRGSGRSTQ